MKQSSQLFKRTRKGERGSKRCATGLRVVLSGTHRCESERGLLPLRQALAAGGRPPPRASRRARNPSKKRTAAGGRTLSTYFNTIIVTKIATNILIGVKWVVLDWIVVNCDWRIDDQCQ